MRKRISTRFMGMITGLVLIALATSAIVLNGQEQKQPQPIAKSSTPSPTQPKHSMPGMKGMAMPAGMEMAPGQAKAMVTPVQQQLIGVKTEIVGKQQLETTIRAVARVDYDEQRLAHVNLRVSGWIKDLFVDKTGQRVRKGQPLFTVYSQELVTAQEEYLLALDTQEQLEESPLPDIQEQTVQMVRTARDRLRLWSFTNDQIRELALRGKPQTYVTIFSPVSGHVVDKQAFKGMYVEPKMTVYSIADLSTVWVQTEIFEYEAHFVRGGQSMALTFDAYPGEQFHGQITYIYPYLNKEARTMTVRMAFPNPTLRLKPDMYGTARIRIKRGRKLAVSAQAVLDSGTRTVVFVVKKAGIFEPRDVTLGPKVGKYYEVMAGLKEGEQVVTSGNFLLDSESQLMASTNMMGALGMGGVKMEQAQMGEMDMDGMDMSGMQMDKDSEMKMDMKTNGSSHDQSDH